MSNKTSGKQKEDDTAKVKISATNSRNLKSKKHDNATLAIATKKSRQDGLGPIKTANYHPAGD